MFVRAFRFGLGLSLLWVATAVTGCSFGHAEVVRRDQMGGVLALRGMQGPAMEDAQRLMGEHCRGPYAIVAEENVVVGQQTTSGSQTNYDQRQRRRQTSGSQYTSATSTTQNVTEYHVTYQCGGAAVATLQQAPPPVMEPVPAPAPAP